MPVEELINRINHAELGLLSIYRGLNEQFIPVILHHAAVDPDVRKFSSDATRFATRETFDQWMKKKRTIYTLQDNKKNLLGISWFGDRPIPQANYTEKLTLEKYTKTFAIRLYAHARGKGLAYPFLDATLKDYLHTLEKDQPSSHYFWIDTPIDNIPGLKTYTKLGFHQVSLPSEKNEVVMVLDEKYHE
jgi:GNAT superfamily N-acetyltransferase